MNKATRKIITSSMALCVLASISISCMQANYPIPNYLLNPDSCSLVIDYVARFKDKKLEGVWDVANKNVVNGLVNELRKQGYGAHIVVSRQLSNKQMLERLSHAMKHYKCKQIIKIVHKKDKLYDFGYDVEILIPDIDKYRSNGRYILLQTYSKKYRFEHSEETFNNLSLSGVGKQIANDIIDSNLLSDGFYKTRSNENIQIAFDKYKGDIYRIYLKYLKQNPGLSGEIVFRITVESGGKVVESKVANSSLVDLDFAQELNEQLLKMDFGRANLPKTYTFLYPIEFKPAKEDIRH